MLQELKLYKKKFLDRNLELDESGTRLLINSLLSDVLGYLPLEEIKKEYIIRAPMPIILSSPISRQWSDYGFFKRIPYWKRV